MFTYPIKREKIILTKLAMVCSFTGISIAISYALCVVYVTIAEAIFDVTASTITLELIIYGIKEMIISVILGSVLSLFPYIIGMTKKSVSIPIIIGSLVAFMQTPIMGRNPALTDAFLKIAIPSIVEFNHSFNSLLCCLKIIVKETIKIKTMMKIVIILQTKLLSIIVLYLVTFQFSFI